MQGVDEGPRQGRLRPRAPTRGCRRCAGNGLPGTAAAAQPAPSAIGRPSTACNALRCNQRGGSAPSGTRLPARQQLTSVSQRRQSIYHLALRRGQPLQVPEEEETAGLPWRASQAPSWKRWDRMTKPTP